MSAPTFNKYRSTTIYGNLSVRDFTNSAGTSVIEVASTDLSGNFISRGDSTFTKKVVCNALLADINANNILTTKEYVDSAVSSGGSVSLTGTNNFTGTNTFNTNLPTSTQTPTTSTQLTTKNFVDGAISTAISGLSSVYSTLANEVKTNTANTFTGQNIYSNNVYCNSILDVRTSQSTPSTFRVAIGDIDNPTLPTASAEQFKQIGELTITQASSTPQTETIDYNTDSSIIQSYNIPANFTKNIICNIPVGIRNTGTCVNSGTASSFTITNLFNSLEVKVYVNSVLMTTLTSANVSILNSNSNTRSSTISYTSTGTKSITLNQYFFNLEIDLKPYLDNDLFVRNNGITNTLTLILKANITNTLTKVSNTGNFTATINTALIANTSTSTFSGAFGTNGTATYSPNSNGTNYAIASFNSIYLNLSYINNSGTTYANYLLINKLYVINDVLIDGITSLNETQFNDNIVQTSTGYINQLRTLPSGFANQFISSNFLEAVEFSDGFSQNTTSTATNTLHNLTLNNNLTTNKRINLTTDTTLSAPSANQLGYIKTGTFSTSAISIGTQTNLSSISLSFGIWIVVANVVFQSNATTGNISKYQIGFNNNGGTAFTSCITGYGGSGTITTTASNTSQLALTISDIVSIPSSASVDLRVIANITYAFTTMSINTGSCKFTAVRIA